MGLVKEKPLSEVELGIREIEERCQKFYEEEQAQLRKQRSEKRALENKYDSYSNNIIRRMRIHVRNIAEKWDNRGKR